MNTETPIMTPEQVRSQNEYLFTDSERAMLSNLRGGILQAKEKIHDLNVQLEQAQAQLRALEAKYGGAVELTAQRLNMTSAEITPDQSKLVRK